MGVNYVHICLDGRWMGGEGATWGSCPLEFENDDVISHIMLVSVQNTLNFCSRLWRAQKWASFVNSRSLHPSGKRGSPMLVRNDQMTPCISGAEKGEGVRA